MALGPERIVLAVDRADAPLEGAVALAERTGAALEVCYVVDAGWAYLHHYPAIGHAGGGPPADLMAPAVRVARRRLQARLEAQAGGQIVWSVREVTALDPHGLGRRDLLMLAHPRLLRSVTEAACSIHIPGPGRGAEAAVVAFCKDDDEDSIITARAVATVSRRRFALVHEGTVGVPGPREGEEGPLWTQRLGEREFDVREWLRAVSPAGVVLPPGAARRLFLALTR